jgi:predicted alternative tryptophan synthase beta-subunit
VNPTEIRSQIESASRRFDEGYSHFLRKRRCGSCLALPWACCAEVWLKLEHLQVGGSFKARGMLNRLLSQPIPAAGVIVASGGNAGIATAAAARALGVPCEVFVPEVSTEAKRAKLRELGATVVVTGAAYAEALQACLSRQQATGALLTHAYDQPEVVVGARHAGPEIEAQGGLPDSVLVSVGGGGPDCRHGVLVRPAQPRGGAGARAGTHAVPCPRSRAAGGCGRGRGGRRFTGGAPHWRHCLGGDRSARCATLWCCPMRPSVRPSSGSGRN